MRTWWKRLIPTALVPTLVFVLGRPPARAQEPPAQAETAAVATTGVATLVAGSRHRAEPQSSWEGVDTLRRVPPHGGGAGEVSPLKSSAALGGGTLGGGSSQANAGIGQGRNFDGARQSDFGVTPPDCNLAVGRATSGSPGFVVEAVNGGLLVFDKVAGPPAEAVLPFPQLFNRPDEAEIFDPKIVYDSHRHRYVVVALETLDATEESFIHIAVSTSDDPRRPWLSWATPANQWSLTAQAVHVDFPSLGYDVHGVYVGANVFPFPRPPNGAPLGPPIGNKYRIFDKFELVDQPPAQLTVFDYDEASGAGLPWAMRAASALGAGAVGDPVALYVGSYNLGPGVAGNLLRLVKIKEPHSPPDPARLVRFDLQVPTYRPPTEDAPQDLECSVRLDVLSGQLLNAVWRNGSLYTAHGIRHSGRNLARWYQIQTSAPKASVTWSQLIQSGEIDAEGDRHSFFPAVAVNRDDAMAVVFAASSEAEYAGVWATARTPCDPEGSTSPPVLLRTGTACYFSRDSQGRVENPSRWGDYFGLAVDAADSTTFWGVGEFAEPGPAGGDPVWSTHVEELYVSENCPTCSCEDLGDPQQPPGTEQP